MSQQPSVSYSLASGRPNGCQDTRQSHPIVVIEVSGAHSTQSGQDEAVTLSLFQQRLMNNTQPVCISITEQFTHDVQARPTAPCSTQAKTATSVLTAVMNSTDFPNRTDF